MLAIKRFFQRAFHQNGQHNGNHAAPPTANPSATAPTIDTPAAPAPATARKPENDPPALHHLFRALIFDWDGTAVVDRHADATELVHLTERLVEEHVWLVVVTGTNVNNIHHQYTEYVTPQQRHHVLLCVNRGSEVYGFDHGGTLIRRYLRAATPEEDRALTEIADGVVAKLRDEYHLEARVIYNRLNRRKIDLIPTPEWEDPPKAQIGALLQAVNARLDAAHVPGRIQGVIEMAKQLAREKGLDARITSDVKHVEVGLTDKADATAWIRHDLLQPEGIAWEDVLIGGDEFGKIAGFEGSDNRMRVGVPDVTPVVSVGVEPNGVPPGVIWLGGGPPRFAELLRQQIALHDGMPHPLADEARATRREAIEAALATAPAPGWSVGVPAFVPDKEQAMASYLAISNGAMGNRGSLEIPSTVSKPRDLVAGLFAMSREAHPLPFLASAPDWIRWRITVDGSPVSIVTGAKVARALDLRRGLLGALWEWQAPNGTTLTIQTQRGVSLASRALGWHIARIDVDRPAEIILETWLEPLDDLLIPDRNGTFLQTWHTNGLPHTLAVASSGIADLPDRVIVPAALGKGSYHRWIWQARPDHSALYERLVTMVRDDHSVQVGQGALAALCRAREDDPDNLFAAHILAWENRWQAAEAAVFGDENAQLALRFAVYSLISAANPDDPTISVGARALTGDAYHGHIFWDTEIYLLPFYTVTWPEAAEAMLRYRSTSLPAARAKAASLGYRGALFAWESTDTGEETTPESVIDPKGRVVPVLNGKYEQHISADVAYAVWQYWLATDDANFLLDVGAEIILETARFWASRGTVEADGRYHIRGVIGPDEYHEGVDDNAYTNLMARWNIARGIEVAGILALRWPDRWRTLQTRLDLSAAELEQWQDAARRMYIHQNADGIFEQFDGYFQHDPIDFAQFPDRSLPIDVQLGREQTQRSQVLKQADVVMALALLWDEFDPAILERNFRYYEARTAHGSSLSPSIHAQVAARLGDTVLGLRYFQHAADIDIADSTRSEAQGIHIATQGGLWQAAVLGFAGVDIRADGLHLDPHLPETWSELNCALHWHRREICIEMIRTPLTVAFTMQGRPCDIFLGATTVHLEPNQEVRYQWDADAHTWMAKT